MGNYLIIGNAGFTSIRKGTYVDKTGMISFVNSTLGTAQKLTCVSRPRRFGKSFAATMLCAYYDRSCDSRHLFADIEIANASSFEEHLNKYDVIYLDMTLFISGNREIKSVVPDIMEKVGNEVRIAYPDVNPGTTLYENLANVADATGSRFIFIIDEWDALFREAKDDDKVQKEYIQLLRSLFKSSLTDKMIAGAYMTGILPIKKYGTQSAMTDFCEYSMLSPGCLAEYVGFAEPEVRMLCEQHHMDFEQMKDWYDGYAFRRIKSVYNPNSVIKAITNGEFDSYWTRQQSQKRLRLHTVPAPRRFITMTSRRSAA